MRIINTHIIIYYFIIYLPTYLPTYLRKSCTQRGYCECGLLYYFHLKNDCLKEPRVEQLAGHSRMAAAHSEQLGARVLYSSTIFLTL